MGRRLIRLRERNQLTLPSEVVEKLSLQPGDYLEVVEAEGNKVEIHPARIAVQGSAEAQESEKRALDDVKNGRFLTFDSVSDLQQHVTGNLSRPPIPPVPPESRAVPKSPPIDEAFLVREAQRGNQVAFEELVRHYDQPVLRLARHLTGSIEDAQDIYQEAFLRVYKNLGHFRFECSFYTWLYRIVTNLCLDHLRHRQARQESAAPSLHSSHQPVYSPESDAAASEALSLEEKAVEELAKRAGDLAAQEKLLHALVSQANPPLR